MRFTWLAAIVLFGTCAEGLSAQAIYYAVSDGDGENYLKKTWHANELSRFRKNPPDHVFDSYTFQRLVNSTSTVVRQCSSPTGDWAMMVKYSYGKNGLLTRLQTDLAMTDGPRYERSYSVSRNGTLNKTSERITGKDLDGSWQPPVKHWMSLSELPLQTQDLTNR